MAQSSNGLSFNPQPKLTKKKEKSERKKWHRKCWKLMSECVRLGAADWRGNGLCYTCDTMKHWKELHAGHYIHGKLDFDERNLKAQCAGCNTYRGGRLDVYTLRLIDQNGREWVEQLRKDAAQHPGYTLQELKEIHERLTKRRKELSTTAY